MGARSNARKRAVEILYEADLRGMDAARLLEQRVGATEAPAIGEYAVTLVSGVAEHRDRIDQVIVEYSEGWALSRMPVVDRAVLRLGFFEMLWGDDVPPAVVIDEAVQLVKALSTDDSPRFVNGVLGRLAGIGEDERSELRDDRDATDPDEPVEDDPVTAGAAADHAETEREDTADASGGDSSSRNSDTDSSATATGEVRPDKVDAGRAQDRPYE